MTRMLAVVMLAVAEAGALASTATQMPGEQWGVVLGADPLEHQYGAATVSPATGDLVVALGSHPAGDHDTPWSLSLWTVNTAGVKTHETPVQIPGLSVRHPEIRSFALLEGGGTVLAGEDETARSFVAKVAADGRASLLWQGGSSSNGISIVKVVAVKAGIIIAGRKGQDAYVAKIDASGKLLWEKTVDRGKIEEFADGLRDDDGGAVLVGSSWSGDAYHVGPSTIWLAKYDADGALQQGAEKTFPGRYPALARGSDGAIAVVYDKGATAAQEIAVQGFGPRETKPVWQAAVAAVARGLARFRIAALRDGGYATVGSQDFALHVSRLGRDGAMVWSVLNPNRRAVDFDLVPTGDGDFYIVYPALSTSMSDGQRRVNTKIGLIKFVAK